MFKKLTKKEAFGFELVELEQSLPGNGSVHSGSKMFVDCSRILCFICLNKQIFFQFSVSRRSFVFCSLIMCYCMAIREESVPCTKHHINDSNHYRNTYVNCSPSLL